MTSIAKGLKKFSNDTDVQICIEMIRALDGVDICGEHYSMTAGFIFPDGSILSCYEDQTSASDQDENLSNRYHEIDFDSYDKEPTFYIDK